MENHLHVKTKYDIDIDIHKYDDLLTIATRNLATNKFRFATWPTERGVVCRANQICKISMQYEILEPGFLV